MTLLRDGPLSRPRGGSIQWQGDDPAATLLRAEFFGAALSPVAGTLSATLADATLAAAGTIGSAGAITGTASNTLAAATLTSTSTLRVSGTLAGTLGTALASGAGGLAVAGTLAQTLGAATVASTGTTLIAAAVAQALADATLVSTGTLPAPGAISGSLASTLGDATLAATATVGGGEPVDPGRQGGGGGSSTLVSIRPNNETREAVLAAYEAAERARDIQADIPAQPEPLKPAPRKAEKPAKRRDISGEIRAIEAAAVANTAMADALAKVGDGIAQMQQRRLLEDEEDAIALLLILAEV